ncbi:MAG: hypothetical protein M1825_000431 [Sarcosagium campestre]|nr:MAG: hypothetical protein M1825_000431 [Sarcosagium campestre]
MEFLETRFALECSHPEDVTERDGFAVDVAQHIIDRINAVPSSDGDQPTTASQPSLRLPISSSIKKVQTFIGVGTFDFSSTSTGKAKVATPSTDKVIHPKVALEYLDGPSETASGSSSVFPASLTKPKRESSAPHLVYGAALDGQDDGTPRVSIPNGASSRQPSQTHSPDAEGEVDQADNHKRNPNLEFENQTMPGTFHIEEANPPDGFVRESRPESLASSSLPAKSRESITEQMKLVRHEPSATTVLSRSVAPSAHSSASGRKNHHHSLLKTSASRFDAALPVPPVLTSSPDLRDVQEEKLSSLNHKISTLPLEERILESHDGNKSDSSRGKRPVSTNPRYFRPKVVDDQLFKGYYSEPSAPPPRTPIPEAPGPMQEPPAIPLSKPASPITVQRVPSEQSFITGRETHEPDASEGKRSAVNDVNRRPLPSDPVPIVSAAPPPQNADTPEASPKEKEQPTTHLEDDSDIPLLPREALSTHLEEEDDPSSLPRKATALGNTIQSLEELLNEALLIARNAAGTPGPYPDTQVEYRFPRQSKDSLASQATVRLPSLPWLAASRKASMAADVPGTRSSMLTRQMEQRPSVANPARQDNGLRGPGMQPTHIDWNDAPYRPRQESDESPTSGPSRSITGILQEPTTPRQGASISQRQGTSNDDHFRVYNALRARRDMPPNRPTPYPSIGGGSIYGPPSPRRMGSSPGPKLVVVNRNEGDSNVHDSLEDHDAIELAEMTREQDNESGRKTEESRVSSQKLFSLKGRTHISLRGSKRVPWGATQRHKPIARDWSTSLKRFVAAVACISTALIGLIVGVYAGEVPAIQYQIVDLNHYTILGNVVLYIGVAIPTLFFWSLPLLHGRKPYTLGALTLSLPLQLPQALAIGSGRSPYVASYRVALLLSRTALGFVLGFANINFQMTLLDLFGASFQSKNPHQEIVDIYDVRRHGGGLGIWLGVWSWCFLGSIGLGFLFGALIINTLNPSWGFWLIIVLTAVALALNVIVPEVRRSSYRRSVAIVQSGADTSKRLARGEVKMHLYQTGPKWWWEEVRASLTLCLRMIKQPGFAIMALYEAWIYGQIVLVMMLLGALTSKYYRMKSPLVGAAVCALPIGALLAIPFQKASLFSRSRKQMPRTDSMTFEKRVTWTSHLLRRAIFMVLLPFADLAFTLSSGGPPTPSIVPIISAGAIGFLSNLAIAECNGLIMETYDTSDLQPGMTGQRPRASSANKWDPRRTNYSCFPRISAAFAIVQSLGFLIAAAGTAVGGRVERRIGAQASIGVVAAILLILTVMLHCALWRFKEIQVIPSTFTEQPASVSGRPWRPVIIGNPSGRIRRMSLLELGSLSRWTQIRQRNRLYAPKPTPNAAVAIFKSRNAYNQCLQASPIQLRIPTTSSSSSLAGSTSSAFLPPLGNLQGSYSSLSFQPGHEQLEQYKQQEKREQVLTLTASMSTSDHAAAVRKQQFYGEFAPNFKTRQADDLKSRVKILGLRDWGWASDGADERTSAWKREQSAEKSDVINSATSQDAASSLHFESNKSEVG